jgi:hypothetical protein
MPVRNANTHAPEMARLALLLIVFNLDWKDCPPLVRRVGRWMVLKKKRLSLTVQIRPPLLGRRVSQSAFPSPTAKALVAREQGIVSRND